MLSIFYFESELFYSDDQVYLVNNADSLATLSSISTNAIVKHNGNVSLLTSVIFKSSCTILVKYFPFDLQK
jgi:nicotinic acetylcholine receptor